MATITFTIPDAQLARVIDAVSDFGGWTPTNPLTRAQFAKRFIADRIKQLVLQQETNVNAANFRPTPPDVD